MTEPAPAQEKALPFIVSGRAEEPEPPPVRQPNYDLYNFRGCTAQRTKGDGVRGEDRIMIVLPGCETEHVIPIDRAVDLWTALGGAIWLK